MTRPTKPIIPDNETLTPTITAENTTTFNIGFGLSGSVSVDFTTKDGSDELYITKHGADPVDIKFTAE